jgi:hypothetical protein
MYLHIGDYTEELGYCLDGDSHHYFQTASDYFADHMTGAQRLTFRSSYVSAWNRFEKWAAANHKVIVLDGEGNYSLDVAHALLASPMDAGQNMIIVISAIALVGVGALAYMLIRKKKSVK